MHASGWGPTLGLTEIVGSLSERTSRQRAVVSEVRIGEETSFVVFEDVVVSESALLRLERKPLYGKVSVLADEELADPDELVRQVIRQGLEPVLLLPEERKADGSRASVDEDGVAWGPLGQLISSGTSRRGCGAGESESKLRRGWRG